MIAEVPGDDKKTDSPSKSGWTLESPRSTFARGAKDALHDGAVFVVRGFSLYSRCVCLAELELFLSRRRWSERAGVQVRARASEVSSAAVMVTARARKKLPVTPVTAMRGRKTTTGVMVEKTSGVVIS